MADTAGDLFNIEVDEFQKKAKVNSLLSREPLHTFRAKF